MLFLELLFVGLLGGGWLAFHLQAIDNEVAQFLTFVARPDVIAFSFLSFLYYSSIVELCFVVNPPHLLHKERKFSIIFLFFFFIIVGEGRSSLESNNFLCVELLLP